jgi:hypothetical protein
MPFIEIAYRFQEEDEITNVLSKEYSANLRLNTSHIICYYPNKEGDKTNLDLTNGRLIILNIPIQEFEDVLASVEDIFDLTDACEN